MQTGAVCNGYSGWEAEPHHHGCMWNSVFPSWALDQAGQPTWWALEVYRVPEWSMWYVRHQHPTAAVTKSKVSSLVLYKATGNSQGMGAALHITTVALQAARDLDRILILYPQPNGEWIDGPFCEGASCYFEPALFMLDRETTPGKCSGMSFTRVVGCFWTKARPSSSTRFWDLETCLLLVAGARGTSALRRSLSWDDAIELEPGD
jgi:hypothetical protein